MVWWLMGGGSICDSRMVEEAKGDGGVSIEMVIVVVESGGRWTVIVWWGNGEGSKGWWWWN